MRDDDADNLPPLDVGDLHDAVLETLLDRVRDPECKAADLSVAVRFCRDCGVTAGRRNQKMKTLERVVTERIPFPSETEVRAEA